MTRKNKVTTCIGIILVCTLVFIGILGNGNTNKSKAGAIGVVKVSSRLNVRTGPGSSYKLLQLDGENVKLKNGCEISIIEEQDGWYSIEFLYNSKSLKGFVYSNYIEIQSAGDEQPNEAETTEVPQATTTPQVTVKPSSPPLSQKEFKAELERKGFPSDYIAPLLKLHEKYPYWEFDAFKTGLEWDTVIENEAKAGVNLLSVNKSYDWKSIANGAYDWKTDKYIPYDGSTWVTASEKAVKYYMDPRNFLDERGIFQFELLSYQKDEQTQQGVENVLYNTPMYNTSFSYKDSSGKTVSIKYSKAFMDAAEQSNVSPYHLASRVKQEVVVSSSSMSSSVSGNVSGFKGIYNFYNIGAYNSTVAGGAVANGLKWAKTGTTYQRPWTDRYKSIIGGAQYIGKNYINVGQNTLYLEKFNVTDRYRYDHQYMGNVEAPNSEATKTVTAYGSIDSNMPITFSIPVYENMPSEPCEVPSGGKNPNNYLKTLYIKNHEFSNKFVLGDDGSKKYKVTVDHSVTDIKICATKVSQYATLKGTGKKALSVGKNTFTVKVTSESGDIRKYKLVVNREKQSAAKNKTAKKKELENEIPQTDNSIYDLDYDIPQIDTNIDEMENQMKELENQIGEIKNDIQDVKERE